MNQKNDDNKNITITDSSENFETWINRSYISEDLRHDLREADILLIPQEGIRERETRIFPVKTEEFFNFLKKNLPSEYSVNICIEEDEYKELAYHSELAILAGLVVSYVALPILINLLTDYISSKILRPKEKNNIKLSLTIVYPDRTSKNLEYEGDANKFLEIMRDIDSIKEIRHGN